MEDYYLDSDYENHLLQDSIDPNKTPYERAKSRKLYEFLKEQNKKSKINTWFFIPIILIVLVILGFALADKAFDIKIFSAKVIVGILAIILLVFVGSFIAISILISEIKTFRDEFAHLIYDSERQREYNIVKLAELESQAELENVKYIIEAKRRLKEIEIKEKEIENKLKALPLEELEFKKQYEMELLKAEKEKTKLRNDILGM